MKRSYSVSDIAAKKWVVLPWSGRWLEAFGSPAINASWFISGMSAQGKSSFVMQLGKELCKYGQVLYLSYEEGVNQTFQHRMGYLGMSEVRRRFTVVTEDTIDEVTERLSKQKSAKFVIVDSFQVGIDCYGWDYTKAVALMKQYPRKCFIFISQEMKGQPLGKPAMRLKYICDMKVRVVGFRAFCQGRSVGSAGNSYVVWEDGVMTTSNGALLES